MTSLSSRRWADITDGDEEAASLAYVKQQSAEMPGPPL